MPVHSEDYDKILNKVCSMKESDSFFHDKTEAYVFSALCVKAQFYKNPANDLTANDFNEIIVDSSSDGGVDILLTDPSSEDCDLVIGQSKFYQDINSETVLNALIKMANFYKDMLKGNYANVNGEVVRRFLTLNSEVGENSKIIFVFYTSAPKKRISLDRLKEKFYEQFTNVSNIELLILFAADIVKEIEESESWRNDVEAGKIKIDKAGNVLEHGDDAIIVNASAFSIKELYIIHGNNLLAKNLRYHIKVTGKTTIDKAIKETIDNNPGSFWAKNNGLNIICDSFRVDGNEVKLTNFSIINGGQTVYLLQRNKNINRENDFYLTCKIIRAIGNTEDEKNAYSIEIAKAANWQKPIKQVDLKANSPEQMRFSTAMREVGIFYMTKRGEEIPKAYKNSYLKANMQKIGKLCLSAIFQLPCKTRNTSEMYDPKYYETIFNKDQNQIARLCKELLYIDNYFDTFSKNLDKKDSEFGDKKSFAANARTVCIAFVAFAARYKQGNLTEEHINQIAGTENFDELNIDELSEMFKDIDNVKSLLPPKLFEQKDEYNKILEKLFNLIINKGTLLYDITKKVKNNALTATNFLKSDKNYYMILGTQWRDIKNEIENIFKDVKY